MKINDVIRRSWQVAEDKGWHDKPRSDRVYETLFHTEVSEYAEEVRSASPPVYDNWDRALDPTGAALDPEAMAFPQTLLDAGWLPKPEGLAVELADLVIRWGDYLGERKVIDGPHGDHEDHGTDQIVEDFADLEDKFEIVERLALDEPMEYAALLHRHIASIFTRFDDGDVANGSYELGSLVPMVLVMFAHMGWNFTRTIGTSEPSS